MTFAERMVRLQVHMDHANDASIRRARAKEYVAALMVEMGLDK